MAASFPSLVVSSSLSPSTIDVFNNISTFVGALSLSPCIYYMSTRSPSARWRRANVFLCLSLVLDTTYIVLITNMAITMRLWGIQTTVTQSLAFVGAAVISGASNVFLHLTVREWLLAVAVLLPHLQVIPRFFVWVGVALVVIANCGLASIPFFTTYMKVLSGASFAMTASTLVLEFVAVFAIVGALKKLAGDMRRVPSTVHTATGAPTADTKAMSSASKPIDLHPSQEASLSSPGEGPPRDKKGKINATRFPNSSGETVDKLVLGIVVCGIIFLFSLAATLMFFNDNLLIPIISVIMTATKSITLSFSAMGISLLSESIMRG